MLLAMGKAAIVVAISCRIRTIKPILAGLNLISILFFIGMALLLVGSLLSKGKARTHMDKSAKIISAHILTVS